MIESEFVKHHTADIFFLLSTSGVIDGLCAKCQIRLYISLPSTVTFSKQLQQHMLEAVNYYHNAFHLGCYSSPRSASVCSIKLKIGMFYHMNNIFDRPFFKYLSLGP